MCDYSLVSLPNRLAEEGDHLVVHQFPTGTLGLIEARPEMRTPAEPVARSWWWKLIEWIRQPEDSALCVVCIPPGALLRLRGISDHMQKECHVSPVEVVTFTQIGADPHCHRDAVRFSSGREVLLQKLSPGQCADVLSLALAEDREPTPVWPDSVPSGHTTIS
jgi:hypothetical protein